jgi:hypothetical protein
MDCITSQAVAAPSFHNVPTRHAHQRVFTRRYLGESANMPNAEASAQFSVRDLLVLIPLFGSLLAMTWEVGSFIPTGGFTLFSLPEHLLAATNALPAALVSAVVLMVGPLLLFPPEKRPVRLFDQTDEPTARHTVLIAAVIILIIGVGVTVAGLIFRTSPLIGAGVFVITASALLIARPRPLLGYAIIFICSLIITMGFAVDYTRDYLNSPSDILATIHTKNGVYRGKVLMGGERGVLFYEPDQKAFVFQRQDEIQRIEWPRLRLLQAN